MKARGTGASECSAARTENEDRILVDPQAGLYVVCDGMGGHAAGDVAAELAVRGMGRLINEHRVKLSAETSAEEILRALSEFVQSASKTIYAAGSKNPAQQGMGTTLSLVWFYGARAYLAHVGDSRIYLYRQGKLHQVSKDHTVISELVERGVLPAEAAVNHPMAHVLSRALGAQELVVPDVFSVEVVPGDRFLLCSDGVYGVLSDQQLALELGAERVEKVAETVVAEAVRHGASDNSSAVVAEIVDDRTENRCALGTEEALIKLEVLRGVFLFHDLTLGEMARVVELCTVIDIKAGEFIIREGQGGRGMYLILDGVLEVLKNGTMLARHGRGGHVGEMALVSGAARSASVRASVDSRLLHLQYEQWIGLIQREPMMGVKLLTATSEELSRRLAIMNERDGMSAMP